MIGLCIAIIRYTFFLVFTGASWGNSNKNAKPSTLLDEVVYLRRNGIKYLKRVFNKAQSRVMDIY